MTNKISYKHTVQELFELQVVNTPKNIAVFDENTTLTYEQLNKKSNQLAHWLLEQKIAPNNFVALFLEPGVDFIVCILAIIKAGAAYLPLDVIAPNTRIMNILHDANPALLIMDDKLPEITSNGCTTHKLKNLHEIIDSYPDTNPKSLQSYQDPMYMLYTSGSTGTPKGVITPHCAVVNLTKSVNYASVQPQEIFAQFSNIAFDASIFEIWSTLLNGATLAIIPAKCRQDYKQLQNFFAQHSIDYLFLPTGYFHQLAQFAPCSLNPIKTLIIGGEQASIHIIKQFLIYRDTQHLPLTFINGYGPTETTVFSCQYFFSNLNETDTSAITDISIGKTIDNVKSYILDSNFKIVNSGEIGELFISGINLALGYNNNDLNEQKFLPNPFDNEYPYQRLYKTGDIVRKLPDGNIIYIGRTDDQVKIQGFRVHLGEIENQLISYPEISLAIVVAEKDSAERNRLIAYLMLSSKTKNPTSHQIRAYLAKHLPSYMLPEKYIKINNFPLSSIGKIDRNKLTHIEGMDLSDTKVVLPTNAIEKKLTSIWSQLLHNDHIDVTKNLFELGATSLLLVQACHEINQALHYECPLQAIITYPSIRKLSPYLHQQIYASHGSQNHEA